MLLTKQNDIQTRADARRRGSTLLLVVVVLLMVLLMGMAYLQIVREDRKSTAGIGTRAALESVTKAAIEAMGLRLHEDRIDASGQLLPDEGYDYPGDKDQHLASTSPDMIGSNTVWGQTSLVGTEYADGNAVPVRNNLLAQDAGVLYDAQGKPNDAVDTTNGMRADADGDYIIDSRTEVAPIAELGGLKWFTSYRLVDLSSLLDVNVATAMTTAGGPGGADTNWGGRRPRGYNPAHMDLTRMFRRWINTDPAVWSNELSTHHTPPSLTIRAGLLPYRFGLATGTNAVLPTDSSISDLDDPASTVAQSVGEIWWGTTTPGRPTGARRYGSSDLKLGIENELELRQHNGLNNASTTTELESQLLLTLQSQDTQLDYTQAGASGTTVAQYLLGIDTGSQTAPFIVDQRRFPSLRPLLTTASGADDFLPEYFARANINQHDQVGNLFHRYDLLYQDGGALAPTPGPRTEEIAKRLLEIFQAGTAGTDQYLAAYGGTDIQRANAAYTLAAAAQDYSDTDSNPTLMEVKDLAGAPISPALRVSGLERLPFLRETYMQARYQGEDIDNADGDNDPTTGNYEVWNYVTGSEALLIELGNPFTQEIDLTQTPVRVVVNGVTMLPALNTAATGVVDARDDASANDLMLLVWEPTNPAVIGDPINGGEASGAGEYGADVLTDLGIVTGMTGLIDPIVVMPALPMTTWFAPDTDIALELQVEMKDAAGAPIWVTYERMAVGGFALPLAETPAVPSTTRVVHAQRTMARDGQMIRYIGPINGGTGAEIGYRPPDELGYRTRTDTNQIDAFAEDAKGGLTGSAELDNVRLGVPNRAYFTSTELGWTPILGIIESAGTVFSVPEVISIQIGLTADKGFFLDFSQPPPTAGGVALPSHAAMAIDRFTTISPLFDGVDNDGDTNPDEVAINASPETFIPGRLNINTTPLHIATLAAPIPDSLTNNEAWLRAIFAYRDVPAADDTTTAFDERTVRDTTKTPPHRTEKGIEGLAELMDFEVKPLGAGGFAYDTAYYALNGTDDSALPINLFPMPEDPAWADTGAASGFIQEERLARMQFIQNTFTVRSDLYAAYILIRGYDPNDLKNPVVQRRVVVILDRSNVFNANDPVRILGMYQE